MGAQLSGPAGAPRPHPGAPWGWGARLRGVSAAPGGPGKADTWRNNTSARPHVLHLQPVAPPAVRAAVVHLLGEGREVGDGRAEVRGRAVVVAAAVVQGEVARAWGFHTLRY